MWLSGTGNYTTPIVLYPTTQPDAGYYGPQGPFHPDDMGMEMGRSSGPSNGKKSKAL